MASSKKKRGMGLRVRKQEIMCCCSMIALIVYGGHMHLESLSSDVCV